MPRRDRHGRATHADGDPRRRPSAGYRLRSRVSFERVVADALAGLAEPVARAVDGAPVDVSDVPAPDAGAEPPFVTVDVDAGRVRRVTVHRRVAEQHAVDRVDLTDCVRDAIELEVGRALGLDPDG